ncbi:MAG: recombinase RecB, partial [Roseiflexus sp.]|nr:recombinase RecB [Roseiflexus sp.]
MRCSRPADPHRYHVRCRFYRPVAIVLHSRPTRWDRLLLDAWRWLVGQTQGKAIDLPGELWLGASGNGPALVKRQSASLALFTAQVWRAAIIATGEAPPVWFDNDHCPFCTWRTACDAAAHETRDIALLPGLSRRQGIALRQRGIHRIEQVVTLEPGVLATLPDRLPYGSERLRLQAQALLSDQPQPTGTGAPQLPHVGFFLDIESDPLTREPWAFGLAGAPGDRMIIVVDPTSNGRFTT